MAGGGNLMDGLGGEEVTQSGTGLPTTSIYSTGSITAASILKTATNVVCTGSVNATGDVISSKQLRCTGSVVSTGRAFAASRELAAIGDAGSPSTWGYFMQAGSGAAGAGSSAWISFPTAFTAAPKSIVIQNIDTANKWAFAPLGSWQAGSFFVLSEDASANLSWLATGDL